MKIVDVETTTLELRKLTGKVIDEGKLVNTLDLIEATLDNIPQGGFTPKDIRERNRIQLVIDKFRENKELKVKNKITFEDADYDNLKVIVGASRWGARDKILQGFLDKFI